ncbi:protein trunk [Drosophila tropicalis]|uniref:protein trunk n=1 Tax=Drosophila tropicalis TaxID=46794 RepID=UPI0035AC1AC3
MSRHNFKWFWICLEILISTLEAGTQDTYCAELSQKALSLILGQAFNPRYMSIGPPARPTEDAYNFENKRFSHELSFYVDEDVISLGSYPAWDTNHFTFFEKKEKDLKQQKDRRSTNIFADKNAYVKSDLFKPRPWECLTKVNWIDLGLNYFPRYIRSIECVARKCWYGHFNCKPKSFTIKVLRRKAGSCIQISDKLIFITSEKFETDQTQLWIWEEIAVNFCCECVMLF